MSTPRFDARYDPHAKAALAAKKAVEEALSAKKAEEEALAAKQAEEDRRRDKARREQARRAEVFARMGFSPLHTAMEISARTIWSLSIGFEAGTRK